MTLKSFRVPSMRIWSSSSSVSEAIPPFKLIVSPFLNALVANTATSMKDCAALMGEPGGGVGEGVGMFRADLIGFVYLPHSGSAP